MTKEFYEVLNENKHLATFDIKIDFTTEGVAKLTGEVDVWQEVVDIGHIAGRLKGTKGVINNISAKAVKKIKLDRTLDIENANELGVLDEVDITENLSVL